MINLDNFIKIDFIKKSMMKSCRYITNENEVTSYVFDLLDGHYSNAIFETSNLRRRFFEEINYRDIDVNVVNCDSSLERFCESLNENSPLIIFNNVNRCHDTNILDIVRNTKSILIC